MVFKLSQYFKRFKQPVAVLVRRVSNVAVAACAELFRIGRERARPVIREVRRSSTRVWRRLTDASRRLVADVRPLFQRFWAEVRLVLQGFVRDCALISSDERLGTPIPTDIILAKRKAKVRSVQVVHHAD